MDTEDSVALKQERLDNEKEINLKAEELRESLNSLSISIVKMNAAFEVKVNSLEKKVDNVISTQNENNAKFCKQVNEKAMEAETKLKIKIDVLDSTFTRRLDNLDTKVSDISVAQNLHMHEMRNANEMIHLKVNDIAFDMAQAIKNNHDEVLAQLACIHSDHTSLQDKVNLNQTEARDTMDKVLALATEVKDTQGDHVSRNRLEEKDDEANVFVEEHYSDIVHSKVNTDRYKSKVKTKGRNFYADYSLMPGYVSNSGSDEESDHGRDRNRRDRSHNDRIPNTMNKEFQRR